MKTILDKFGEFLNYPKDSGLMFLVLVVVFLCNFHVDTFADEVTYNKNWVNVSTKSWIFPNSAYSYYTNTTPDKWVINRHYDFSSSQSCVVVAVKNYNQQGQYDVYRAFAIALKTDGMDVSPFLSGSAYWDNEATMNIGGSTSYNMTNLASDWYTVFPEWVNSDYWVLPLYDTNGVPPSRFDMLQYDYEVSSASELRSMLEEHNFNPFDPNAPTDDKLPMLHYHFDRQLTYGAQLPISKVKECVSWVYSEHEIYANNPNNYIIQMIASTNWKSSPTGIGQDIPNKENQAINEECKVTISDGGCNIATNYYSFFYQDVGQSLYATKNYTFSDEGGYYVYIRTKEINGDRVSDWKVYNLALGGYVQSQDVIVSSDNNVTPIPEADKDPDNLNPATYTPDNSTSSGSDPSSVNYNGESSATSASTLMATLRSVVNDLKDLPNLLAITLSFLPTWVITLISLSIGILVIIGVVKFILRG